MTACEAGALNPLRIPRPLARPVALYDDSAAFKPAAFGPGVDQVERCLTAADLPVERLTRDALNAPGGDLSRYSAMVLPGGFAYPGYTHLITEEAKGRIRQFVADGGVYMGICAGAFFASRDIRWHGVPYGPEAGYSLNLFDGTAAGPIAQLADYPEWAPTVLASEGPEHPVWYAAGPWLESEDPAVKTVATYSAPGLPQQGAPAVVTAPFGDGHVVLWGPHPEGHPEAAPFSESSELAGRLLRDALFDSL